MLFEPVMIKLNKDPMVFCFFNIVTFKSCLFVSGINSYPGSARAF